MEECWVTWEEAGTEGEAGEGSLSRHGCPQARHASAPTARAGLQPPPLSCGFPSGLRSGLRSPVLLRLWSLGGLSGVRMAGSRPAGAWLSRDLLVKLRGKRERHRQWKQGQISWEEHRDAARLCRDGVRRANVQTELDLARDAENNKKGFYRYVSQKRKVKESVPPR